MNVLLLSMYFPMRPIIMLQSTERPMLWVHISDKTLGPGLLKDTF